MGACQARRATRHVAPLPRGRQNIPVTQDSQRAKGGGGGGRVCATRGSGREVDLYSCVERDSMVVKTAVDAYDMTTTMMTIMVIMTNEGPSS